MTEDTILIPEPEETYQEFLSQYYDQNVDAKEYNIIKNKIIQKISQYANTIPAYTKISPHQKIITVTLTETRYAYITYKNMKNLAEFLGVDDITVYTPTRDLLIIDYNNYEKPRIQEEPEPVPPRESELEQEPEEPEPEEPEPEEQEQEQEPEPGEPQPEPEPEEPQQGD